MLKQQKQLKIQRKENVDEWVNCAIIQDFTATDECLGTNWIYCSAEQHIASDWMWILERRNDRENRNSVLSNHMEVEKFAPFYVYVGWLVGRFVYMLQFLK